jgi:F-type H+-transporting ATPase subunit gamma
MPTLTQIKTRIRNVKSTNKLIKAMQTISALRMKKNCLAATTAQNHLNYIQRLETQLLSGVDNSEIAKNKFFGGRISVSEEVLAKTQTESRAQPILSLIISPARGFCAGLHRTIVTQYYRELQSKGVDTSDQNQIQFITVNKPASKQVSRLGGQLMAAFDHMPKIPSKYDILAISELIYQLYSQRDYSELQVVFLDIKTEKPKVISLLPFNVHTIKSEVNQQYLTQPSSSEQYTIDTDPLKVLDLLLHQLLQSHIYFYIWSTMAAEEKARMMAMSKASDNAKEMLVTLQRGYFKQRQAKITQEMNEIISSTL